ncbi:hypothetical protein GIB67_002617 [Kingdonia uniflora]|uniref:mannan endo-1,4-beta-mannosidase n=1 Tax=Kingdonia uniflora TaxID=39325 RepID=A0A7J7N540_9MAGN|nr:hypothetical protein GIB67_002617 [Kingdonia uniflora]
MKKWGLFLLIALLMIQQESHLQNVEAAGDGFIQTRGMRFVLNGSPYYANGFNAYWLMYVASDPSQRNKVTSAFQQASRHGLTVARTWAFSDGGYRPLQYSPGSYNENMFKGLDFVISEARKYGIKLILSFVNNYESLGGKKQYVEWAKSQGQYLSSEDGFFTSPVVKGYYKNHVKTVITRHNSMTGLVYKDDSTIMAWELMNEPRCTSDLSGKTIQRAVQNCAATLQAKAKMMTRVPRSMLPIKRSSEVRWVSSSARFRSALGLIHPGWIGFTPKFIQSTLLTAVDALRKKKCPILIDNHLRET